MNGIRMEPPPRVIQTELNNSIQQQILNLLSNESDGRLTITEIQKSVRYDKNKLWEVLNELAGRQYITIETPWIIRNPGAPLQYYTPSTNNIPSSPSSIWIVTKLVVIIIIISAVIGYFSKGSAPETSTAPILTTPMVNNRDFETLSVKDSVIVQAAAVRVRQFPGLNTHINCEKHAGDKLQISGGPITVDGLRWWTVTSSNCTGWIAQKDRSGITLIARTE